MPRSLIYDVALSLDGFICGPGDSIDGFPADGPHVSDYQQRLSTYDTVVMGRGTYEFGFRYGLRPGARAYPHMMHYIFSRSLRMETGSEVHVVNSDAATFVSELKESTGGDIYLCGGSALAGCMASAGLIDLLSIKLAPVVLGAGKSLFSGGKQLNLHLESSRQYCNGVVLLEYAVVQR